jgi:hypothetical protein
VPKNYNKFFFKWLGIEGQEKKIITAYIKRQSKTVAVSVANTKKLNAKWQ